MAIKKVLPKATLVLPFEEHHRVVQFVALLVTVARRVDVNKKKCSGKRKNAGRKHKIKQDLQIRKSCFLNQNLYHESINLAFTLSDYHDRYHSINP